MDHYIDIHLRPDPELAPHQLLSGLYARLHRALVQLHSNDIGISFPGYDTRKPSLGKQLRLHGQAKSLAALAATIWLHGIHDHLIVTETSTVPEGATFRRLSRVQAAGSSERQTRRALRRLDKRRDGLSEAEVVKRLADVPAKHLALPYIVIGSQSTGQPSFPLFIQLGPVLSEPVAGHFNSYGLSHEATIPWF